jgi:hypothetical protein
MVFFYIAFLVFQVHIIKKNILVVLTLFRIKGANDLVNLTSIIFETTLVLLHKPTLLIFFLNYIF